MAFITLVAPAGASTVQFGQSIYAVNPEAGTVTVPRAMAPSLIKQGCQELVGETHANADVAQEIESAEDHELSHVLHAAGHTDHRWEKNIHIMSKDLREKGLPFIHHGPITTTLTVQKDDVGFAASSHEVLIGATIASPLVPVGTKVEHISGTENGISGRLKLPDGATVGDIKTGTDEAATASVIVDQHMIADYLDDYHMRFHAKGRGRIVFYTTDEKREIAKKLIDRLPK